MKRTTHLLGIGLAIGVAVSINDRTIAAPVMPGAPISGYLFDETYDAAEDTVTDSFGSRHGLTQAALVGEAEVPTDSADAPFAYGGNRSISIGDGDTNGRTAYVAWEGVTFANALHSASATSVQLWVKFDSLVAGTNGLLGLLLDFNVASHSISANAAGRITVGGRSQIGDTFQSGQSAATLVADQWNQIVGVFDYANDQIRISINGGAFETFNVTFGSDTLNSTAEPTDEDQLASRSSSEYIGLIDEFAIWDFALTQDHVEWLNANSLHAIPEPGSVALCLVGLVAVALRRR